MRLYKRTRQNTYDQLKKQLTTSSNPTFYKIVQLKRMQHKSSQLKSNSESALPDFLTFATASENSSFTNPSTHATITTALTSTTTANKPSRTRLIRSASIDPNINQIDKLSITSDVIFDQEMSTCSQATLKPIINPIQDTTHLIDPHQIPRIVRKSLIDLHKKSMLNVSAASQQQNLNNTPSFSGSNNSSSSNSNGNSNSVYTQQRHKNEIKMKINKH